MAFSTEDMDWAQRDKVRRDRDAARARGELPPKVDVVYGNGTLRPTQYVTVIPGDPVRPDLRRKKKPELARRQIDGKPHSVKTKPNSAKREPFRVRWPRCMRIFVIGYDAWIGEAIQAEIKRHDPSLR